MTLTKHIYNSFVLLAFLLPGIVSAAEKPDYSVASSGDRENNDRIYSSVYDKNPSLLTWWDYGTWSVIGVEGYSGKGMLHSPLSPDGSRGLKVETRSILHQKDKGWSFSGKFSYSIGVTDSLRSILSYRRKPYGSPSFFYCLVPAKTWEVQQYALSATATKNFHGRWSVGAQLDYTGDKQFRKTDVRNDQSALEINVSVGASVLLGSNILSAGLSYERNKEQPNFSILYNSGERYTIYLMNGMGTQMSNLTQPVWQQNVFGGYVGWAWRGDKNRLAARAYFKSGKDCTEDKSTQIASRQERWTEYSFSDYGISATDILHLSAEKDLIFDVEASLTSGKSSGWNQASKKFIQNYNEDMYEASVGARYVTRGWFRKAGVNVGLNGENRLDKNYDARLDYMTLTGNAFTGFGVKAGKVDVALDLDGGISNGLSVDYQPNAAKDGSNIYTTNIGRKEESWLETGVWNAGVGLQADIPIRKVVLNVGGRYRYAGEYSSEAFSGQKWQNFNVFLRVWF